MSAPSRRATASSSASAACASRPNAIQATKNPSDDQRREASGIRPPRDDAPEDLRAPETSSATSSRRSSAPTPTHAAPPARRSSPCGIAGRARRARRPRPSRRARRSGRRDWRSTPTAPPTPPTHEQQPSASANSRAPVGAAQARRRRHGRFCGRRHRSVSAATCRNGAAGRARCKARRRTRTCSAARCGP